jgi:hypothetical protein
MNKHTLITDPLHHKVLVPEDVCSVVSVPTLDDLSSIISKPAFLIQGKGGELWYFRLIDRDTNLLVAARSEGGIFRVFYHESNPSATQIEDLLKKGRLYTFN